MIFVVPLHLALWYTGAMGTYELGDSNSEISKQFDDIAVFYDKLMAGVPYSAWTDYIQRIVKKFGRKPQWVLDLCCGAGSVSILLAKKAIMSLE